MSSKKTDSLIKGLVENVKKGEKEKAKKKAQKLVESGTNPQAVLDKLTEGMKEVGKKFDSLEIFLPEMMMAAEAMMEAKKVLDPKIKELTEGSEISTGSVVIGTARGDEHSIGKDIVITMLDAAGVEVHDLGTDTKPLDFIKSAQEHGADIIAISALMTTTMPTQQEVIQILKDKGIREDYRVIVGGAPVTPEWSEEIQSDGYGEHAAEAVSVIENLLAKEQQKEEE